MFDGNLGPIARRVEANKLDFAVGIFDRMPGVRRVPFFRFSLMLVRPDDGRPTRHNTSQWSALSGETLISLTKDYPHEQLIQKQLAKMGIVCKRGQTVNLLDTQIGLVEPMTRGSAGSPPLRVFTLDYRPGPPANGERGGNKE